ncbi:hypothetical protein PQX77_010878 [Marasmius sp. AFHP31]|nr:hypothetical protein PQX77_010878 [Marasmius sp. AFHP31]
MRLEVPTINRPITPPPLMLSISQFLASPEVLSQLEPPPVAPDDRDGDTVLGGRLLLQQWETLILLNRNHYLRTGQGIRRWHMFLTQSQEDLDTPIRFVGVDITRTVVPWSQPWMPARDRLDVILYTLHGLLAVLGIIHPVNTPHARIIQEFERDEGKFTFWAAQLLTSNPVYHAYLRYTSQFPLSPISRQPELPAISIAEESSNVSTRCSSEPEMGKTATQAQKECSFSVPAIGVTSVLMQTGESTSYTREQKGKGCAVDPIPEEPALPHPAQTPEPMPSPPPTQEVAATDGPPAPPAPPVRQQPVQQTAAPQSQVQLSTATTMNASSQLPEVDPGTYNIDQLIIMAAEYSREQDSVRRRQDRHMKSIPIINGRGEEIQWEMDLAWYNFYCGYVDPFADLAHDVLLHCQQAGLTRRFGGSFLTLEGQQTRNPRLGPETHDGLMMAASRFGTRPPSQYTERGVQTNGTFAQSRGPTRHVGTLTTPAVRISCPTQTKYSLIAPPYPEPPEPLDAIEEEDEEVLSDAETHFEGEYFEDAPEEPSVETQVEETPRVAHRRHFSVLKQELCDHRRRVPLVEISSGSLSEDSPPRAGPFNSQQLLSSSFPTSSQSTYNPDSDDEFIPDDPDTYNEARNGIIRYWTELAPDHDAAEKLKVALRRFKQDARREQQKRRQKAKGKKPQVLNPSAQQFLEEWREMKKELEDARDLRRRYEQKHSKGGCAPCGSGHKFQGCGEEDHICIQFMKEQDPGPEKPAFSQTPKHVSWASDVKESDTPLPQYTAHPTPAPDYSVHTSFSGPIDPSVFADTEVFVQQAHEFDTPGSGSSRDVPTCDVPPHLDLSPRAMGV